MSMHGGAGLDAAIGAAAAACREGLERVERLVLPDQPEQAADILADGARATLRRARKALDKAGSRGAADDFHDLRKAAKTHSMHLSLLGRLWPTPIKARRKAVDELGEQLGDLHDVFVMRALLDADGEPLGSPQDTKLLAKLLKRSEKSLRKTCLADAAELFGDSPKRSTKSSPARCAKTWPARLRKMLACPSPADHGPHRRSVLIAIYDDRARRNASRSPWPLACRPAAG